MPSEVAHDVCVSADETTTFFFDSRVTVDAVAFHPEGRLADWAQGKEGLSLHVTPKADYLPGERVRVTVRFADGSVPSSATFWLVGNASQGTRRVEVFRQPRPVEVLKKERDEAQAEAHQCQEDKARLLNEREEPSGLMGAAWLERAGSVMSNNIYPWLRFHPANALRPDKAWSYSYVLEGETRPASVAVRLRLNNSGAEPWMVAGAALIELTGEEVTLVAWQGAPITSNGQGTIVVGAQGDPGQFGCPCTLKLWEAQGPRTVTIGNVTFPVSQKMEP